MTSATKSFNIAGLRCAVVVFGSDRLAERFDAWPERIRGAVSSFGVEATRIAWTECDEWLEALLAHLEGNRDFLHSFVRERLPGLRMVLPAATYLGWLDCRRVRARAGSVPVVSRPGPGRLQRRARLRRRRRKGTCASTSRPREASSPRSSNAWRRRSNEDFRDLRAGAARAPARRRRARPSRPPGAGHLRRGPHPLCVVPPLEPARAPGRQARSPAERSRRPLRRGGGACRARRGPASGPRLHRRSGPRGRRAGLGGGRLHRVQRHQRAEQGVRRVDRARARHPVRLRRGAQVDDGPGRAARRARQPADGRVPGDEHPGRDLLSRGGARAPGGGRRPGPGHDRGGELRRAHPQHHRCAVAHQRRHREPGDRASQRDHGLASRGLRGRARPGRPAAAPRGRLARGIGAGGGEGRGAVRGRERGRGDPRRLAGRGGRTITLHLRRSKPRGVPRRPPRGRGPRRGRAARAGDGRVRRHPRCADRPRRRRRGAGDPHRLLAPADGLGGVRGAGRPRGRGARLRTGSGGRSGWSRPPSRS